MRVAVGRPAMPPRAVAPAWLLLLACLLTAGCLPPMTRDGAAARPEVGRCYDTPDRVLPRAHDPSPAVDCSDPHTLQTYAVLRADGPLDAATAARLGRRCSDRAEGFLGGDHLHTAVSLYYFTPSQAEQADGQRWVRCDVGLTVDAAAPTVRRVTGTLKGAFADGVPLRYRRCLDARPQPLADQRLVPCTAPHTAQLMPEPIDVGDPEAPYPGTGVLAARANAECAPVVRSALPDAGRSVVIVPTQRMWRAGLATAQCWALAAPGQTLGGSEAQPA